MTTRIERIGDGLAVRIPDEVAARAGLTAGAEVVVTVEWGAVVARSADKPRLTLDDLLRGITDENIHTEADAESPYGKEGV